MTRRDRQEAGGRGRRGRPRAGSPPPVAQPAGCADFPTTGGLNWCGLAKCESGLNPNAYNPAGPYYGLYQFDQQTWKANGGAGSPSGKSIAEQTAVAWSFTRPEARAPWPVCGKNLYRGRGPRRHYRLVGGDGLLGPAEIRGLAVGLGITPTKSLGQNFLHDPNTIRRIVRTAALGPTTSRSRSGPGSAR